MGIQHLEDLSVTDFLDALRLEWKVAEKIDGSYLEFGLDDTGKFFSRRKGFDLCRSVDDWSFAPWSNGYRMAHEVAQQLINSLILADLVAPGDTLGAEVIFQKQTNTIEYNKSCVLCIIKWPHDSSFYQASIIAKNIQPKIKQKLFFSYDGKTITENIMTLGWDVVFIQPYNPSKLFNILGGKFRDPEDWVYLWLSEQSGYQNYTNQQILNMKLSHRPRGLANDDWQLTKDQVVLTRASKQQCMLNFKRSIAKLIITNLIDLMHSQIGSTSWVEGIVITTDTGLVFKVVDKASFLPANHFTHKIKYFLVGGTRPAKPSFITRTKGWSQQRKVRVLELILERYIANHTKRSHIVIRNNIPCHILSYGDNALHYRTLDLFADLRKRILNGRYGL